MKKNNILKAFALSMIMILGLVMPMAAQTDSFFKSNNEDIYENRAGDPISVTGGITNQQFGDAPVGSGLLIMVAAGAGYAVARRRRSMRKAGTMLLALAMVLTFTQCRKRIVPVNPTTNGQGLHITVRVDNDAKHSITLSGDNVGKVDFTDGDFLWVLNNNQIVGQIFYNGNTHSFSGSIGVDVTHLWGDKVELKDSDYLYFTYTNNEGPEMEVDDETGLFEFSLDIADQTEKLPLVSFGRTDETLGYYKDNGGLDELSCELQNKCALVKFELDEPTADDVMLTKVCSNLNLDIYNMTITPETGLQGVIQLYNPAGENASKYRWGIILSDGNAAAADAFIGNTVYQGAVTFPTIHNNMLIDEDHNNGPLSINLNVPSATIGRHCFYNPMTGGWLEVAKGNLKYTKSTNTYSFITPAYGTVETSNQNVGDLYANQDEVSLFGYGAWGTTCPYNTVNDSYNQETGQWSTNYAWQSDFNGNLQIDGKTGWRTMTDYETYFIFNGLGVYYTGTVAGVHGLILLSMTWDGTMPDNAHPGCNGWGNVNISAADWPEYENHGAFFFPYAGRRSGVNVSDVNSDATVGMTYWTHGQTNLTPDYQTPPFVPHSLVMIWDDDDHTVVELGVGPVWAARYGFPVRLARDITFTMTK